MKQVRPAGRLDFLLPWRTSKFEAVEEQGGNTNPLVVAWKARTNAEIVTILLAISTALNTASGRSWRLLEKKLHLLVLEQALIGPQNVLIHSNYRTPGFLRVPFFSCFSAISSRAEQIL